MSTSEEAFDCRATAGLLRAMGTLVWASHAGALVAASYRAWIPLLAWGVVLYFAVRVRFDAELFDLLAGDPEHAPAQLDRWLSSTRGAERSMADRCRGGRRLARNLAVAVVVQLAITAVVLLRNV